MVYGLQKRSIKKLFQVVVTLETGVPHMNVPFIDLRRSVAPIEKEETCPATIPPLNENCVESDDAAFCSVRGQD